MADLADATAVVYAILHRPIMGALARPAILLVGRISCGAISIMRLFSGRFRHSLSRLQQVPLAQRLARFALVWSLTVAIAYASFRVEMPIID